MAQTRLEPEPFVGRVAAAAFLGISPWTLDKRVQRREVPHYRPNGHGTKPVLFLISELETYRAGHSVKEHEQ